MVPPESTLLSFESPAHERLGCGELTLSFQQNGEVVDRAQSVWMVPPESTLPPFESPTK